MTGHVTYACSCLNVRIHLANKYYLEGHEKFRKDKFVRLSDPPLSGWKFDLGMEGVIVEYKNLVRMRHQSEDWVTVSCHNCKTGDVYSVKRPNVKIVEYPIDTSLLSQYGDQVIIHKETIFGSAIDSLKKNVTYSSTFRIVLNPDLPVNHEPLDKDTTSYGPELNNQYKELKQVLKTSLIELEEATEKRIQAYQAEQETLLTREKEKAMYDGSILWQTMKEVSKTMQEEQQRVRRLSLRQQQGPSDHTLFNRIAHEEQVYNPVRIEEPPEVIEQRRRSSVIRRDLFGGQTPVSYNRRSSYVLDESAIAASFKNSFHHHLEPVPEQPPVHQVHPLAHPTDAVVPSISTSSSWEDDEDQGNSNHDESDDLFALDEDMDDQDVLVHKRHSVKYIQSDEEEEEDAKASDTEELQVPDEGIESAFATSVPMNVPLPTKDYQRLSASVIETTNFPNRRPSFVGFDYAAADRRQSLNFSPVRRVTDTQNKLQEGPMVPPHILAANTAKDEAIFGSVPRNSIRHRPLE